MANNTPVLDLLYLESHSSKSMVIADISRYPDSFNISTPTIEITPPGFPSVTLEFVARGMQVYTAEVLEIACPDDDCFTIALPDGVYNVKYSIYPAYLYNVEKNFFRVNLLLEKFDSAYLKLDILQCDLALKEEQKKLLDRVWSYINGAIASANKCAFKQATELYKRAHKLLDDFINNRCP